MGKITDYTLMPAVEVIDINDDKTHAPELGANNFGIKLEEVLEYGHLFIPTEEVKYYELEKWFEDEAVPAVIEGGGYFLPINRLIGERGWIQLKSTSRVGMIV